MKHLLKLLLVLVIVAVAVPSWQPVRAQGGLTPDQQALLDRVTNAMTSVKENNFSLHRVETQSTSIVVTMGDQQQTQNENVTVDSTASYIPGATREDWNVQESSTVDATGSYSDTGDYAYTLTAEVRLVNGVVYVNATRESQNEASLPPMPQGWTIVNNADEWPALSDLQLGDWFKDPSKTGMFDYPELVTMAVTDVTSEPVTMEDGTQADKIVLTLSGEGLRNAFTEFYQKDETADPSVAALYSQLSPDSTVTLTITLDANDKVLHYEGTGLLGVSQLDMSQMMSNLQPGQAVLDMNLELGMTSDFLSVGEDLTPAEAPEVAPTATATAVAS